MQTHRLDGDMETPGNESADGSGNAGFWKRQFQPRHTSKQTRFDWWFGIGLPLVCVMADPILFKSWAVGGDPALLMFKPFAYILSFTSIMGMLAWLIFGPKLKGISAVLAGLFFFGSLISFGMGLLMLPLSLIGLMFYGVGIFGFVPLFSAFVYLRNGVRAFRHAGTLLEKRVMIGTVLLSALFSGVIPWTVNIEVDAHRPYHQQKFRKLRGL